MILRTREGAENQREGALQYMLSRLGWWVVQHIDARACGCEIVYPFSCHCYGREQR